jgi:hypothetical protein
MMEPMLFIRRHTSQLRKGLRASPGPCGPENLVRAPQMSDLHKNCPDTHKTDGQVWSSVINGQEQRPAILMSPGVDEEGARRENGGRRVGN